MQFLTDYVEQVKAENLYRQTVVYRPVDAADVQCNGQTRLLLASNNYLGLTHNPAVRQAAVDAIGLYGTGAGGARLTTGTFPLYEELERELAAFKGAEAALVFNSGYMANTGIISALADQADVIFSDALNHASLIDGCRLSRARVVIYRHADMEHLAYLLQTTACPGKRLIITDGVFSMDGDIAPLGSIVQITARYNALIVVDDAHATGVIGPGGRGTAAYCGVADKVHVQIGTLSKALGAEGGFVTGSGALIDYLKNKARSFIFSTALAPATIAAALAALRELAAKPELVARLTGNADHVRTLLQAAGIEVPAGITPIIPVIVGDSGIAVRMTSELQQQGLLITAIRPPTVPAGTSRLRLTVTAAHEREELTAAVRVISRTLTRLRQGEG